MKKATATNAVHVQGFIGQDRLAQVLTPVASFVRRKDTSKELLSVKEHLKRKLT